MEKILVSACLLGQRVRYDAKIVSLASDLLSHWRGEGRLVVICPEVAGGLGVPRPAAELQGGDGHAALDGEARLRTRDGEDVTAAFLRGAEAALELARQHDIRLALLKERSPSCGRGSIYDGAFAGQLTAGDGVTAALLTRHGVEVFGESRVAQLAARLAALDPSASAPAG